MPYGSSPGMASGMVIACGRVRRRARRPVWSGAYRRARRRIACRSARRPITSRHIPARVGDLGVCAVVTVRHAERPSSAMPRPNMACSRRRQPLFCGHSFFCNAVAFKQFPFGGAAKAPRWAAPQPDCSLRNDARIKKTTYAHRAHRNKKRPRRPRRT